MDLYKVDLLYANIETSHLLQKMEEYEGIFILATNLRENMDEAFTRRLRFIVEFPFPDEASRRLIWKTHFPPEAPLSEAIDYEFLARKFQIAGGNIKNIVMIKTPTQPKTLSLELPSELVLQVTQEQFEVLAAANRDLQLERTAEGELIVNPPTGGESGKRNFSITGQLARWYEEHEDLGEGFDSSTGFRLPNGADRSPDASWVRRERWESLTTQQRKGFVPLCPDFVIELRSESDSLPKLQAKIKEFIDNGARLGWLIDPQNRRVEIYRPGREMEVLENTSNLSGEDILPGFVLNLRRVWT